jgi:hypothetical protein
LDAGKLPLVVVYDPPAGKYIVLEGELTGKELGRFLSRVSEKKARKTFKSLPGVFELEVLLKVDLNSIGKRLRGGTRNFEAGIP